MENRKFYFFFLEFFSFTHQSFYFHNKIAANFLELENQVNAAAKNLLGLTLLFPQHSQTTNLLFNISLNELSLMSEFFLGFTSLVAITYCSLTLYSEFYKKRILLQFSGTFISILILCFTVVLLSKDGHSITKHLSMDFSFLNDSLGTFAKIITVLFSLMCVYLTKNSITRDRINYNEYDLLILYAILGLLLITTANDLTTIFLTLELQGLSVYVLAGIKRNSMYSVESGLKYIFIASLSTGYYLLGSSLLFGISGLLVLLKFQLFYKNFFIDLGMLDNETKFWEQLEEKIALFFLFKNLIKENNLVSNESKELEFTRFFGESEKKECYYSNGISRSWFYKNCTILKTAKCLSTKHVEQQLLLDDAILAHYNEKKGKISIQEFNSIECDFCRELLIVFKTTDEKNIAEEEKKKALKLQLEKIIYRSEKKTLRYLQKKRCFFCEILLKEYLELINEEKRKKKIIYSKRMNVYERRLPEEVFAKYYKSLSEYFKKRDQIITKETHQKALTEAFFNTCEQAHDYRDLYLAVPCSHIAKRFKNAWEVEYIKNSLLPNKIEQACKNMYSREKNDAKFCKEIKPYLIQTKLFRSGEIDLKTKKKNIQNNLSKFADINFYILLSSSLNFILISFFFKLAGAPFHLWSLDIYEGSPTSSTIFFAVVTKFSIIVILARICYYGFHDILIKVLYQYVIFVSILSAFVGAIAGLREQKLKSLLAYSSINNVGYLLLTLAIGTLNSIKATLFYLIVYLSSSLATWSGLLSIQIKKNRYIKKQNKDFADLVLIKKNNPVLTLLLHIALFSTAGLPPFIGFLTKMNVFLISIESHIFLISLATILLSMVSSFYYLRLIKITCFEKTLIGKLHQTVKLNQSNINNTFGFFLPYQFLKPGLSIFFSYKIIIC